MSIKLRLALLLGLLLGGLLVSLLVLRAIENAERERVLSEERRGHAQLLSHWVDLTTRNLPEFASDASQSAEFNRAIAQSGDAAAKKIEAELTSAGAHSAWIVASDGSVRARF